MSCAWRGDGVQPKPLGESRHPEFEPGIEGLVKERTNPSSPHTAQPCFLLRLLRLEGSSTSLDAVD